jgi:hypothetical protein
VTTSSINLPLSALGSMARLDRPAVILPRRSANEVPRQRRALKHSLLISAGQPCERPAGKEIRAPIETPIETRHHPSVERP